MSDSSDSESNRSLPSRVRPVPTVLLSLLVVLSVSTAGFAASGGTLIDDFEDGLEPRWNGDIAHNSTFGYESSGSGDLGGGSQVMWAMNDTNPESFQVKVHRQDGNTVFNKLCENNQYDIPVNCGIDWTADDVTGDITIYGGSAEHSLGSLQPGVWHAVYFEVDWQASTYDAYLYDLENKTLEASVTGIDLANGNTEFYWYTPEGSGYQIDDPQYNADISYATSAGDTSLGKMPGYSQEFLLDDPGKIYGGDARLLVYEYTGDDYIFTNNIPRGDWQRIDSTTFNHNQEAYTQFENGTYYAWAVVDEDATNLNDASIVYEASGFQGDPHNGPITLRVSSPAVNDTNVTSLCDVISDGDGYAFVCEPPSGGGIGTIDYEVSAPGFPSYNGSLDFQNGSYYYGDLPDNFSNISDLDDIRVEWGGEYENGTAFNGTFTFADLLGGSSESPFGGPTGGSGGTSSTQQTIAWGLIILLGYAGYRRFNDGPTLTQLARRGGSLARSSLSRVPGLGGDRGA